MKAHVIEGNTQQLDGGAMFGNAPKSLWTKWSVSDERNRIPLACRCLLIQTDDGRNILFETGIGVFFEPKLKERYGITQHEHILLKNLATLGLTDSDINAVVLSHLHFDHAGGLLSSYEEGPLRLLFPKAQFYLGKDHWVRAQNPHKREQISFIPILNKLLAQSGRLHVIETNRIEICGLAVNFHYSHGHTIGLMLSELALDTGPLVFVSDLVPGLPWVHLPIVMGYDRFPERTVDEKKELYNYLLEHNGKLFFTHDPTVPCALLKQDADGKFFGEPVDLSLP